MKKSIFITCVLLATAFTLTAQNVTPTQKSITVTGVAETEVVPDEIYVQVDLREYDKKGFGKIGIDSIKRNFLAACRSIGLPDSTITLQAYQGYDNSYWLMRKTRKKDPDLKASISYTIKLSTVKTMDALVDVLDDEATQNFFIAKVDYSKATELKKQLKISAIKAAKAKAIYLTEAIDEHLGGAVTITDIEDRVTAYDNSYIAQTRVGANVNYRGNTSYFQSIPDDNGIGFKKLKFQFQVNVEFALQ